ncbi:MAG: TetR/AcrR family transcriptional regulator [Sulfuricurvum sp.]|nr:TetR/AcrR family transcriptional regulator [Sulfuricurvum sp.]
MRTTVGRPKSFDEGEVLALAMNYFWEHGYENSSLDDLLTAMGIKKSSFYHTFKNKEDLFSRCLELYGKTLLHYFETLKNEVGPKAALLALSEGMINELKETGKIKGCLLMNSGKECYNRHSALSHQIGVGLQFLLEVCETFVKEAQERGEISNLKEAKQIAGRYINAFNGMIVTIQAGANQEVINDLREHLSELLE